jgi:hypothetical protein
MRACVDAWMDMLLLLLLHHARLFHFHAAWDQGDTRATPKIVPILLIQHNRVTT